MTIDLHVFVVFLVVLGLVMLDWLMGILVALANGSFKFRLVMKQLESWGIALGALLIFAIVQAFSAVITVAGVQGATSGTFYGAASAMALAALIDIATKARAALPAPSPAPAPQVPPPAA